MKNVEALQLIRSLDGISYGYIILLLMFLHPTAGRNELGNPGFFFLLPVITIGWFCYRMPDRFMQIKRWPVIVSNVRLFSFALICLMPFILWYLTISNSKYLFINSQLSLFVGIGFLFHIAIMIHEIAIATSSKLMEILSKLNRIMLLYFILVPLFAFIITYFMDVYIHSLNTFGDFFAIIKIAPYWLRYLVLFPLFLSVSLVFSIRYLLVARYNE